MKTILIILLATVLLYAKAPYWVQVIAVKHPSSLTKQFLSKTKKCYKNYHIVRKNGFEKVWLGKFRNNATANNAKKFFQTCLAKNAFVIKGYIKQNHKILKSIKAKTVSSIKTTKIPSPKIVKITADTVSLQINTKSLTQNRTKPAQNPANKRCNPILQKQQIRQSEIAAAIKFYTHSKYYRFSK